MIRLTPPQPSTESLKAMAASGSSGIARKAQRLLQDRITGELRQILARQREA